MPIPTIYTEPELIAKLQTMIRPILDVVGWADDDPIYSEVVIDTLNEYGVTDIADASDVLKLLKLARMIMWRSVVDALAGTYDFSDGGASYSRSQAYKHATERYNEALNEATEYLTSYQVTVTEIYNPDDVYRVYDSDEYEQDE